MQCVDLGLVLTDCQETVCHPEKNIANFVSIFESQTVSQQSAQVPMQHCKRGSGEGGRGRSSGQNLETPFQKKMEKRLLYGIIKILG